MATFGKGVEYALHCLLSLHGDSSGKTVVVADLAEFQGVSETYLAKIFTKLKKAGLVRSSIGAKGGYELARPSDQITFWDVVRAVEGELSLFECRNIRANCQPFRDRKEKPKWMVSGPCTIHKVMLDVEDQVRAALKAKTLAWLAEEGGRKIPKQDLQQMAQWFIERKHEK